MASVFNEDVANYFIVANEPYNVYNEYGVKIFEIFRGQYFRWIQHVLPNNSCKGCGTTSGMYTIQGYANCKDDFKNEKGNNVLYHVPDHIFEETYDTEDNVNICESWFHETGGYNKDIFTPPHLRNEYKDWNAEKKLG